MAKELRFTLAQLNPTTGDIDGNAQQMLNIWHENKDSSDLILFPELFLCGYPSQDLVLNAAFLKAVEEKIIFICKQTEHYAAAAIIPTILRENEDLFNAALLIEKGEIKGILKKHMLPNENVFDEPRVFKAGSMPEPQEFRGHKLGIVICEDLWYPDVAAHLKKQGAEILISLNASPYNTIKHDKRNEIAKNSISKTNLSLIYLNMCGGQDELTFDGQSFIMNSNMETIYIAPAFEDEVLTVTFTGKDTITVPSGYDSEDRLDNSPCLTYEAITTGLKDYVLKNGFKNVLIGLSGGIDSALAAAVAVDALGCDNVRSIMLPSEFTSQDSIDDALECAKMLGIKHEIISIKGAVTAFEHIIPNLNGLAHENTQSRIRGTILMALSNTSGEMLVTTGNKSEVAVGYCTLYGDMCGGFNPLKDVYKTDVYRISAWRNELSKVIPERILTKYPTAELRENQKDQDSLPPYDLLDDILKLLIEYDNIDWKNADPDLITMRNRCMEHPETITKIAKLLKNSEFKRFQSAPGTRTTFRAFGSDRRYPMTNHFVNKIEKDA
ncbi:MAG: NAD+ synthase [Zetaproteobacteria bacterium]|nr:MAG: NAD+ synthase [Zetaproteobacteria bacterium]